MKPLYNVPIIPLNLRKEETIVQIAEALQYLEDISEDIFKRINERIELNSQHLSNISERIDKASKKIQSLSGAKKATQVFSSSKYPASHVNRQYRTVFGKSEEPLVVTRHKVECKSSVVNEEPLDRLYFYHVKLHESETKVMDDNLGPIPTDIESVNDLLLFNTGKNVYKKYELSDALKVSPGLQEDKATSTSDIAPAPLSISDRSLLSKTSSESYFYTPNLGEVPSIDVPLDLPDLPGIADDLRFETDSNIVIAPSVTTTPSVPDLPDIAALSVKTQVPSGSSLEVLLSPRTFTSSVTVGDISDSKSSESSYIIEQDAQTQTSAEILEVVEETKQSVSSDSSYIVEQDAETQTSEILEIVEEKEQSVSSHSSYIIEQDAETQTPSEISVNTPDAHASLMEAIRKAGGLKNARLKSAESAKAESTLQPGDLMADLHAKLAMRRKGISGAKAMDDSNGGNAMDKVSAMIPPPPPVNDISSSTNTEDDDWDE